MSGKQDKKSRRLKASLNGHVKKRVLEEQLGLLQAYQNELRKQSLWRRLKFSVRLICKLK